MYECQTTTAEEEDGVAATAFPAHRGPSGVSFTFIPISAEDSDSNGSDVISSDGDEKELDLSDLDVEDLIADLFSCNLLKKKKKKS